VLTQTRRHSSVAHQLGIPHLLVAVNKMDLVGWSEAVFDRIRADYLAFAGRIGIDAGRVRFIPISALAGDMVVERGANLVWWRGPTLLEELEQVPSPHAEVDEPFRFPVQWVCRPQTETHHDFRGFAGRVESGSVAVGDELQVLPSGRTSRVKAIWLGEVALSEAVGDQSVLLQLEDEIDISRGDLLVRPTEVPPLAARREVEAVLCWLSERPLSTTRRYLVRHTTRESRAQVTGVDWRLDMATLEQVPADSLAMNDLGRVRLRLAQPIAADRYRDVRATGAFIVIDEASNDTVGAGMIL
jgi:sulfate adenylyltransferase subunit 1